MDIRFTAEPRFCRRDGCTKLPKVSGFCDLHYQSEYKKTSDGIRTGRIPKLNESDCVEIRKMYSRLKTKHEIAKSFGVGDKVVRKVLNKTYTPRSEKCLQPI